jgi:hypothetical protein
MKTRENDLRRWREKKVSQGYKSLCVWLDPGLARKFNELKRHFGGQKSGKNKTLIAKAINDLHSATFNR